jgi:hypothetical protein
MNKETLKQSVQKYEQQGLEKYAYELKQETLEEAAYRLYPIVLEDDEWDKNKQYRDEWIEGAKWQQERRYSEEDMIAFALFLEIHLPMKPRKTHHQLLEQFKKK